MTSNLCGRQARSMYPDSSGEHIEGEIVAVFMCDGDDVLVGILDKTGRIRNIDMTHIQVLPARALPMPMTLPRGLP